MRLDGHCALVTGGTQGVGGAIAIALAKAGCRLVLQGLQDDEHCRETVKECQAQGVPVSTVFVDLSGPTTPAVAELLRQVDEIDANVSLLVNNVGTFCDESFLEMRFETFHKTMVLNVYAGYFLTQAYARRWVASKVSGRILFTGSINGELAEPDHTAYDTSKGAVRTMVRSLCVALAPVGIRVNAIAPGLVISPLTAPSLKPGSENLAWMKFHTPNGQVPSADVCGSAAVFLLSDHADHIHGQTLFIDGGMSVWQQPLPPAGWSAS